MQMVKLIKMNTEEVGIKIWLKIGLLGILLSNQELFYMTRMRTLWLFSKLRMKYWHKKDGKQNRKRKQEGAAPKIEIRCVINFLYDFSSWNMRGLGNVGK
ncbi:hypothetical protein AHAS_Ahas03G0236500 [Arachis hypogaea]